MVRRPMVGNPRRLESADRIEAARPRQGRRQGSVPEYAVRFPGERTSARMNIEQLDRLFTAVSKKHRAKSFVVIGSLSVLGLVNERPIPESMTVSAEVDAYPEN